MQADSGDEAEGVAGKKKAARKGRGTADQRKRASSAYQPEASGSQKD